MAQTRKHRQSCIVERNPESREHGSREVLPRGFTPLIHFRASHLKFWLSSWGSVVKAPKGDRFLWPGPLINSWAMAPFERDPRFAVDRTKWAHPLLRVCFLGNARLVKQCQRTPCPCPSKTNTCLMFHETLHFFEDPRSVLTSWATCSFGRGERALGVWGLASGMGARPAAW